VVGHQGGALERLTILQIGCNRGGAERVIPALRLALRNLKSPATSPAVSPAQKGKPDDLPPVSWTVYFWKIPVQQHGGSVRGKSACC
jgi:hypothetical protein